MAADARRLISWFNCLNIHTSFFVPPNAMRIRSHLSPLLHDNPPDNPDNYTFRKCIYLLTNKISFLSDVVKIITALPPPPPPPPHKNKYSTKQ